MKYTIKIRVEPCRAFGKNGFDFDIETNKNTEAILGDLAERMVSYKKEMAK